jgi:cytochrome b561
LGIYEYIGAVVGWWVLSIVKFLITPSLMMASPQDSFLEIFLITGSGASIGVMIFYFLGERIFRFIDKKRKNAPKRFSRLNRFVARIKARYGLMGILVICGVVSVPISSLLAARYFKSNVTAPLLMLSFWIWALGLTFLNYAIKMLF